MKVADVKIGNVYGIMVSGSVVPVRLTEEKWVGNKQVGWVGVNTQTNRTVRVKSAQRLRAVIKPRNAAMVKTVVVTTTDATDGSEAAPTPELTAPAPKAKRGRKAPTNAAEANPPTATTEAPATPEDAPTPQGDGVGDEAGGGPVEPTEATPAPKAPEAAKPPKERKPKRMSALDAAAQVLAASPVPMQAKQMVAAMQTQGLWTSANGKTPESSLYAAIIREIAAKGEASRFRKHDKGLFVAATMAA